MTAVARSFFFGPYFDLTGALLAGGKLYFYESGTTDTKPVYTSAAATSEHTQPITLDSAGMVPSDQHIYFASGNYKIVFKKSDDTAVNTIDPYDPGVADPVSPAVNKVANGSFEADSDSDGEPDNWTYTLYTGGAAARDITTNSHGIACIRFDSPGGSGNGGGYADSDSFEVNETVPVEVAFSVKSSAAGVHNRVEVRWFTSADALVSASTVWDQNGSNPTSWTRYRFRVTPPATARYARVRPYGCVNDNTTAGSTYFDDVVLVEAPDAAVTTHTASATLTGSNAGLNLIDASGGAVTLTLPAANAAQGLPFTFVRTEGANKVTIVAAGSDTIDGSATDPAFFDAADSVTLISDGVSDWRTIGRVVESPLPRGYISGLTISNNATDAAKDIDFAVGECRDSTDAYNMALSATMVKQLDATWAVGTNAGGLFSGTVAASTWYHCFVIRKDSDGSIDCGFDTSVTAANIPTGYTAYRRVGSILTDATPDIIAFLPLERGGGACEFIWDVPVGDFSSTNPGTAQTLRALTVPTGLNVTAKVFVTLQSTSGALYPHALVLPPDCTDTAPTGTVFDLYATAGGSVNGSALEVMTDTSAQIGTRVNVSDGNVIISGTTKGWIDERR